MATPKIKTLVIKLLKALIFKAEGGVSWSKTWAWVAGGLAIVSQTATQITAAGLTIPAEIVPFIKYAAIASGITSVIRTRNSASPSPTPESPKPEAKKK
jgi:hypothetical protein